MNNNNNINSNNINIDNYNNIIIIKNKDARDSFLLLAP